MLDENLALLVGAEVVVGEIHTDQPGAVVVVVAADARQLRLASAGEVVGSGSGLPAEIEAELVSKIRHRVEGEVMAGVFG